MPLTSIDYSKVVFYKIVCNDMSVSDFYVGSTTNFIRRKSTHKNACNTEKAHNTNYKIYQCIRANGGWDNWSVVPIEEASCSSKLDMLKKEREHYENLQATLNTRLPRRDKKEYAREHAKQHYAQYYASRKEAKMEYNKRYNELNLEKVQEYMKQYRTNNKAEMSKAKAEHYQRNKEQILEKRRETIICNICGTEGASGNLKRHQKSQQCREHVKIED